MKNMCWNVFVREIHRLSRNVLRRVLGHKLVAQIFRLEVPRARMRPASSVEDNVDVPFIGLHHHQLMWDMTLLPPQALEAPQDVLHVIPVREDRTIETLLHLPDDLLARLPELPPFLQSVVDLLCHMGPPRCPNLLLYALGTHLDLLRINLLTEEGDHSAARQTKEKRPPGFPFRSAASRGI